MIHLTTVEYMIAMELKRTLMVTTEELGCRLGISQQAAYSALASMMVAFGLPRQRLTTASRKLLRERIELAEQQGIQLILTTKEERMIRDATHDTAAV